MNQEIKERWTAALRGGEYEQGRGQLRRSAGNGGRDQFCCLGVLCELAVKAGVIPAPRTGIHGYGYDPSFGDVDDPGEVSVLPPKVQEWAGMVNCNPVVIDDRGISLSLAEFNDGAGLTEARTFPEIADIIEANF